MYKNFIKKIADFVIAAIALIILSPLLMTTVLVLTVVNRGYPFYFQPRPGKDNKIFQIIKFKTMNDKKDKNGNLLPAHERITPVGGFIRKYSIDELIQMVNILKGDMSFIGPRPLRVEYLDVYTPEEIRRHNVKPGITGWAQVNGRNSISWKEKFKLDLYYVDHINLLLDLKILFLTLTNIFTTKDINSSSNQTMPFYDGTN